jgi:hypothetical protein
MSLWPWLVAPALMLLLIVGFSVGCLFLVKRDPGKVNPPPEPVAVAVSAPQPDPPVSQAPPDTQPAPPAPGPRDAARVAPEPAAGPPVLAVLPLVPARQPQRPPVDKPALARTVAELPQLSESLRIKSPAETALKEVPRATREREALYDAVVQRFILYDVGRLGVLDGRQAALDFEALGPDAIPALVRGLNRSATLDASCPVSSISFKLGALLASCTDLELIAEVRDGIGKGVGPTPHQAYLMALKRNCDQHLKKSKELLKPRVPQLVAALKSKDTLERRKAANTLGLAGAEAKAAVPALIGALKDADPEARGYAARALAAIGPPAVPALLKAAESSPDPQVRSLACLALGESRPTTDRITRALVAARDDPDPAVRAAAALAR